MNIFKLFRKKPTKREKVSAMIRRLAMIADMPKETQLELDRLDMSVATDTQVDLIYEGLIALCEQLNDIKKKHGRDLFTLLKEKQN
jgi:hypothetical protein